jgi:hypothetical protein
VRKILDRQNAKALSPFLATHPIVPVEARVQLCREPRPSPVWQGRLALCRLGGLLSLLFFSLASPAFAADVAGYWYGEGYQPLWHENAQWLMHLAPDGGYAIEFRQYRYCKLVLDQKETGTWALGDQFRTVTTRVDGRPTRYENDYRVDGVTDKQFDITHLKTGQAYVEKRVGPDFKWPPPICPVS